MGVGTDWKRGVKGGIEDETDEEEGKGDEKKGRIWEQTGRKWKGERKENWIKM